MKKLLQRLISAGADLSTRKTLKTALRVIGMKPENIDKLYIELKNDFHRDMFNRINAKDTVIFLPQCLRNPKKCRAKLSDDGFKCRSCGSCKVLDIRKEAKRLGYRHVFVSPGGSLVIKKIKELKPKAVVGVACLSELTTAVEQIPIPAQGVELTRDGCVGTDVCLKELFSVLRKS
jgi:hypothetical protein